MYDNKSDFAHNKKNKDKIIYVTISEHVQLTKDDFESDMEFQKWKSWSDQDYKETEKNGRAFYDYWARFDESVLEQEGHIVSHEKKNTSRQFILELRKNLTKKQYRRLILYYVKGLKLSEIAKQENVSIQNVSKSLQAAKKRLEKNFLNRVKNGC